MSKKSSENSSTTSTETPKYEGWTTDQIIAELRANYSPPPPPEWYMTTSKFMELVTDVVRALPWLETWDRQPGHPEDIAVSVSMAVDTVSATITSMQRVGILKYRGQE